MSHHTLQKKAIDVMPTSFLLTTAKISKTKNQREVCHPIMDSLTCVSCAGILTSYINFTTTCQGTEEKINFFREIQQKEVILKLSNVLTFIGENGRYSNVNRKKEGILHSLEYNNYFKALGIREEVDLLDSNNEQKGQTVKMYKCEMCQYQTRHRKKFKEHLLSHQDILMVENRLLLDTDTSEVEMYTCKTCDYKTKSKGNLKKHLLVHRENSEVEMYECEICHYKTKRKGDLKQHLLVHKENSEVNLYTCEMCQFRTKRKGNLKKSSFWFIEKIPMRRCIHVKHVVLRQNIKSVLICIFWFIEKILKWRCIHVKHVNSRPNIKVHRENSQVEMYRCETCQYKTKHKWNLKSHLLLHKENSKVKIYTCERCQYKTKYKGNLKSHLLVHRDTSKVETYACAMCNFKTIHKSSFKKHLLVHRNNSEVETYACRVCDFKTKYKSSLKKHVLVHTIYIYNLNRSLKQVLKVCFIIRLYYSSIFVTHTVCTKANLGIENIRNCRYVEWGFYIYNLNAVVKAGLQVNALVTPLGDNAVEAFAKNHENLFIIHIHSLFLFRYVDHIIKSKTYCY
ncbi:hypothetical protein NQ317_004134 [Molorchus minor]|uniref:C2H2-type domain-containing protein n=1 Tax=Molorchus minor TaxID=1323400 RepID=A0ABQ9J6G7_9CUCU|nr:hypothetical protein NQ317_004134 [Molorchus minor]